MFATISLLSSLIFTNPDYDRRYPVPDCVQDLSPFMSCEDQRQHEEHLRIEKERRLWKPDIPPLGKR